MAKNKRSSIILLGCALLLILLLGLFQTTNDLQKRYLDLRISTSQNGKYILVQSFDMSGFHETYPEIVFLEPSKDRWRFQKPFVLTSPELSRFFPEVLWWKNDILIVDVNEKWNYDWKLLADIYKPPGKVIFLRKEIESSGIQSYKHDIISITAVNSTGFELALGTYKISKHSACDVKISLDNLIRAKIRVPGIEPFRIRRQILVDPAQPGSIFVNFYYDNWS